MKIVKYDEQDPDIRLEGVHFNLYTTSDRLVGEGKTDAQGHLVFDGIINRDYVLEEVANPKGYLLPKKNN